MSATHALTFRKEERICSRKLIDKLFNGDTARSMSSFPLRMVYTTTERTADQPPVSIVISVPKRHFHHAVDRNRVKRQVREAYRHHRHLLLDALSGKPDTALLLSFIWMDAQHLDTHLVDRRLQQLLQRLADKLTKQPSNNE